MNTTYQNVKSQTNGWKHVALLDEGKETIKPQNNVGKTAAQNLKEIDQIIPSLPAGKYFLAVRNSPAAKYTCFPFAINQSADQQLGDGQSADQYNLKLYEENVRLSVRVKELETLNKVLEEKYQTALITIEELEDELEESAGQMADGQGSLLDNILMAALPQILEKFGTPKPNATTNEGQGFTTETEPMQQY